jgi:drug/metabolite transporter (DMT)-like permease
MAPYKRGLKERVKVSDKMDRFWLGILLGFFGGLLGNIWVAYMFRWIDSITGSSSSSTEAIISTLFIFCFIYIIWKMDQKEQLTNN